MKPEIKAELIKIGWDSVPWSMRQTLELDFRPSGGLVASSPQSAKLASKGHRKLCLALLDVIKGLEALSEDARSCVNIASTPVEDRNAGWPDHVEHAVEDLRSICPGLLQWAQFLDYEASKAKPGRPKNEAAVRVATAMARIYFIAHDKKPKFGRLADGSGPSGKFGRAVAAVLKLLEIHVSDIGPTCLEAIASLTSDDFASVRIRRLAMSNRILRLSERR